MDKRQPWNLGGLAMNEPVAWMDCEGGFYHNDDYEVCKEHNIADDLIPLYTHPVKELTDEEIEEVFYSLDVGHNSTDFARAILRKAGEK